MSLERRHKHKSHLNDVVTWTGCPEPPKPTFTRCPCVLYRDLDTQATGRSVLWIKRIVVAGWNTSGQIICETRAVSAERGFTQDCMFPDNRLTTKFTLDFLKRDMCNSWHNSNGILTLLVSHRWPSHRGRLKKRLSVFWKCYHGPSFIFIEGIRGVFWDIKAFLFILQIG